MTDEELQELCRIWQKRLRLQDWDVRVKVLRARDFVGGERDGECEFTLASKMAFIRILDPVDYDPEYIWPQDIERTLVHELLHLHFAPLNIDPKSAEHIVEEQAIHALSLALVELARKDDKHGEEGEEASSGKRGEV